MDYLDSLPIDNSRRLSAIEEEVMNQFFSKKPTEKSSKWSEIKIVGSATLLYLILSTGYFDSFVEMLPHSGSPLFKYALKAIIFFSILYVIIIMLN